MTIARPKVESVQAWQFLAQPESEWPSWVKGKLGNMGHELHHQTAAGVQMVYCGEWLTQSLDGTITWYTDREMRRKFEIEE